MREEERRRQRSSSEKLRGIVGNLKVDRPVIGSVQTEGIKEEEAFHGKISEAGHGIVSKPVKSPSI